MPDHKSAIAVSNLYPILSVKKLAFLLKMKRSELEKLSKTAGRYYSPFDRKQIKSNGKVKWRHIDNPSRYLKEVQQRIDKVLLKDITKALPEGMNGGIEGRSIFKNAERHLKQQAVAVLDLKDCFPKTNNRIIFKVWRNYLGTGSEVAGILTRLTTFQRRLPQGSPSSSSLCNLALLPLYEKIEKYCLEKNLNLTLFVDDVTISGKTAIVRSAIGAIINFVQKEGYAVRRNKVEVMTANVPQKTTGMVVNKAMSVTNKMREEVRKEIIQLSKLEVLPTKRLKSLWGKINHIKQASLKHGEKLRDFANLLLLDKSESKLYEKATSEKEVTRECRNTKRHMYGL